MAIAFVLLCFIKTAKFNLEEKGQDSTEEVLSVIEFAKQEHPELADFLIP